VRGEMSDEKRGLTMRIDFRQYAPIGQSCLRRTTRGSMKKILPLLIFAILLSSCGGGSSPTSVSLTSPGVSLVGSYTLMAYYRNGAEQGGYTGELEIGETRIWAQMSSYPPPWGGGEYDYTAESYSSVGYIEAYIRLRVGTLRVYSMRIATDDSMTLVTWTQIDNVLFETFWEKVSDSTTLD